MGLRGVSKAPATSARGWPTPRCLARASCTAWQTLQTSHEVTAADISDVHQWAWLDDLWSSNGDGLRLLCDRRHQQSADPAGTVRVFQPERNRIVCVIDPCNIVCSRIS